MSLRQKAQGEDGSTGMTQPDTSALFDVRDKEPFDLYRAVLAEGGWRWDETLNGWIVGDYHSSRLILGDEGAFSFPSDLPESEQVLHGQRGIFMLRGEEHRRFHVYLVRHLNRLAGEREPSAIVKSTVDYQIDRIQGRPSVDLAADFADWIPLRLSARMLGLAWTDDELLARCRSHLLAIAAWVETYGLDQAALSAGVSAARQLDDLLRDSVGDRAEPRQVPLVAGLWETGRKLFDDWSPDDTLTHVRLLFLAGTHTTSSLIGAALWMLAANQELQQTIRERLSERVAPFLEEVLRLQAPVHIKARTAARDVEVRGRTVMAGTRVYVLIAAANRDPDVFPGGGCPHESPPSAAKHLSFNVGRRFCVGAALARREAKESVAALLRKTDHLEFDETRKPPRLEGLMLRSYRPLHATLSWLGFQATSR